MLVVEFVVSWEWRKEGRGSMLPPTYLFIISIVHGILYTIHTALFVCMCVCVYVCACVHMVENCMYTTIICTLTFYTRCVRYISFIKNMHLISSFRTIQELL